MPNNNPIENAHIRFCKELLGVQRQTTNIGVLLELGRILIMIYGIKNCIKNWSRIHILGKANETNDNYFIVNREFPRCSQ